MAMDEYNRLDGDACQLGDEVTLLAADLGERINRRSMGDKLSCTIRVSQWEKRKGFGNFARWGKGSGVSGGKAPWERKERGGGTGREGELPFWKEPTREHDARAHVRRSEGTAVVRTLRIWSWSGSNRKAE